jgi:hypothetical protein
MPYRQCPGPKFHRQSAADRLALPYRIPASMLKIELSY